MPTSASVLRPESFFVLFIPSLWVFQTFLSLLFFFPFLFFLLHSFQYLNDVTLQQWGGCAVQKTCLYLILINSLLGEWHFHLHDLKSEDLGNVRACESPQVPGTKEAFFAFRNFPFELRTTGLWSWLQVSLSSQLLSRKMHLSEPNAVLI